MADLTEAQKEAYWRYNVRLTTILLVIWFVVTYLISGLLAGWLNQYTILGFPLGYYMAAQGSLAIFVDRDRGVRLPHEHEGRRVRHSRGGLAAMSLDKIFGLYTVSFLGVTVLIGIGELAFGLPNQRIGWIFMALSLLIYVFIGIVTRTSNPDQYYVAGRGVPAFYNGMATGSDWMSAASFISMGGALSAQGFAGLAYVMGWTGGYLLLAVFLGPYLRQFGAYTIPDFLGARYGGNAARIVGVVAADRLLLHVSDRAGDRRRPDRLALHRPRLQRRRVRRPARRAVLLGAGRHAVGHVDPGGAVHHPDHLLPRAGRVPVVAALLDPDPRADLRPDPPAEQQQARSRSRATPRRRRRARSGRRTRTRPTPRSRRAVSPRPRSRS